jgi:hypothetical protein
VGDPAALDTENKAFPPFLGIENRRAVTISRFDRNPGENSLV